MAYLSKEVLVAISGVNSAAAEVTSADSIGPVGKTLVYPTSVVCPAAFDGTLFRIEARTRINGADVWTPMRAPGSGADFPYTMSANGRIPIDGDTMKDLALDAIRIVCATTQTAERRFVVNYQRL